LLGGVDRGNFSGVRDGMVTWAFAPSEGNIHMAAYVSDPVEFAFIVERGFVTLDGQPADLVDADDPNLCDPVSGFMRFRFREPYWRRRFVDVTMFGDQDPRLLEEVA
jgi:hypothetical protein